MTRVGPGSRHSGGGPGPYFQERIAPGTLHCRPLDAIRQPAGGFPVAVNGIDNGLMLERRRPGPSPEALLWDRTKAAVDELLPQIVVRVGQSAR